MDHILTFHSNGTATTLYTDKLPLRELGTLAVQRASKIEFNNSTQEWEVRFTFGEPPAEPAFSHPSREECLKWEREQLNQ
jgi:hypothetical protein